MTIEAGALAIRITEVGGDQVLKQLNTIDAKAKALGQASGAVKISAPNAAAVGAQLGAVNTALGNVKTTTSAATPVIQQHAQAQQQLGTQLGVTQSRMTSLTSAIGQHLLVYLSFRSAVQVYDAVTEASDRQDMAQRKLSATARLTGQSLATINAISDGAQSKFAVSSSAAADLTQGFVKLASRAGNVAQTGALMTAWMDLAKAQGLSLSDVMTGLNSTLVGQDEGVNRLGLANPSNIWAKWAAAAGTTVAKMSDQQKWQAIVNEVMAQGAKVQGEYGRFLESTAGKQEAFNSALERTAASFGKTLAPTREWAYTMGTALLNVIRIMNNMDDTVSGLPAKLGLLGQLFSGNFGGFAATLMQLDAPGFVRQGPPLAGKGGPAIDPAAIKAAAEAAKKAEEERIRAIGETVSALDTLAKFHKLTAGDMMAAIVLEQRLTAEYDKGTTSRKRRAEILGELDKLSGIVLARTKLSDLSLTSSKPDGKDQPTSGVGLDKDGKMHVPTGLKVDIKTIELHGWEKLAEVVKQRRQEVSEIINTVGQDVGNAFGDAFSAAFTGGNFFEEFGKSLLRSLGNMLVQLGASMLAYGLILAPLGALLSFTPFAPLGLGIGASIAAGTALVALGAGMGALAGGGKGGGGGSSAAGPNKPTNEDENEWSVAFDPDRKLRRGSSAVAPVSRAIDSTPLPDKQQPFVFAPTIIGADDPVAQKKIAYMVERVVLNGGARGLR